MHLARVPAVVVVELALRRDALDGFRDAADRADHHRGVNIELRAFQTADPSVDDLGLLEANSGQSIAVNDDFVEPTVDAIMRGGRTGPKGEIGDGKIFVLPMDECVRIRTGERGSEAI